jgi:hypothetical protein
LEKFPKEITAGDAVGHSATHISYESPPALTKVLHDTAASMPKALIQKEQHEALNHMSTTSHMMTASQMKNFLSVRIAKDKPKTLSEALARLAEANELVQQLEETVAAVEAAAKSRGRRSSLISRQARESLEHARAQAAEAFEDLEEFPKEMTAGVSVGHGATHISYEDLPAQCTVEALNHMRIASQMRTASQRQLYTGLHANMEQAFTPMTNWRTNVPQPRLFSTYSARKAPQTLLRPLLGAVRRI